MKQLFIKYWWGVLTFVIILLSLPLFLNWIVTRDTLFDCKVAGDSKDWLLVWITYLSVLSSMAMVIITYMSLRNSKEQNDKILQQNKEQLEEIKKERQEDLLERKESQRPRLVFDIIIDQVFYYLRIRNIGKENAFNVSITVNEDFIQNIENKNQVIFKEMKVPFCIPFDIPKYFLIGVCKDVIERWKDKDIPLSLTGTYCDKYQINESLDMDQFINKMHFVVEDELTTAFKYLKKGVITQNSSYYTIQKSMDIIAKNIEKYMNHASEEEEEDNENNN